MNAKRKGTRDEHRSGWKDAMRDELNLAYPDARPLPDEQLQIQADELADKRWLLLIKSLTALLPAAQCEAVRGILEGASVDDLAAATKLSRQRLYLTLNAAAKRMHNMHPQFSEPPKTPPRPRQSSPAFVPVRPPLRSAALVRLEPQPSPAPSVSLR